MIIIVDLDLTLLNSQGALSEESRQTLLACKQKGHKIVINSARSLVRTRKFAQAIDADFCNCFYGSLLVDKDENVLFAKKIDCKNFEEFAKDFFKIHHGWIGVETIDGAFTTSESMAKKMNAAFVPESEIFSIEAYKLIFEIDQSKRSEYEKVMKKYPFTVVFNREGYFCSIIPQETNKWNGLKKLLQILPHEQTIAFGDEVSDIQTLQNVDIPVAMANSASDLLCLGFNQTKSNDENGVAAFLQDLLLKR